MIRTMRRTPIFSRGLVGVLLFAFLLLASPRMAHAGEGQPAGSTAAEAQQYLTPDEMELLSENPGMMQSAGGDVDDTTGFIFGVIVVAGMVVVVGLAAGV